MIRSTVLASLVATMVYAISACGSAPEAKEIGDAPSVDIQEGVETQGGIYGPKGGPDFITSPAASATTPKFKAPFLPRPR